MTATSRNLRRTLTGVVTSDAMDKSISVVVERRTRHAKYGKYVRHDSKFMAHDESNAASVGDTVEIAECRPLSKNKRWRLVRVVTKGDNAVISTAENPESAPTGGQPTGGDA